MPTWSMAEEKPLFSVTRCLYLTQNYGLTTPFFRVAPSIVLESGCEHVVPGAVSIHHAAAEDMVLSPTKSFIEKHQIVEAHMAVQECKSHIFQSLQPRFCACHTEERSDRWRPSAS